MRRDAESATDVPATYGGNANSNVQAALDGLGSSLTSAVSTLTTRINALPLPASMVLIAAGAFAQQGVLGAQAAAAAALAGAVLGDSGSYGLGRFAAPRIPARMRA